MPVCSPALDPASTNLLRSLAVGERPQERFLRHGPGALSDTELLALLLRKGTRNMDVLTLASNLVAQAGSLPALLHWKEADLLRIKGIGRVKAIQLLAVFEIARRVLSSEAGQQPVLSEPQLVYQHLQPLAAGLDVEKFWVLCLNRRNRLMRLQEVTSGTATSSLVHPREVFREAIRSGATGVICAHNHPSGDPAPSSADLQVTRQLGTAARAVDIDLLDHVIVGRVSTDPLGRGYYSFREAGLL